MKIIGGIAVKTMREINLIHKAIVFTTQKHDGQKRKIEGTPYEPLPPERIEQIIKSLKQLWQSDNYKEMRFFQLVEVLGNEYKNENSDCDLWNLHDEIFASWLGQKLKTISSRTEDKQL